MEDKFILMLLINKYNWQIIILESRLRKCVKQKED